MGLQLDLKYGESTLSLSPLKAKIKTDASDYSVGKVKIEIRLVKVTAGRWGAVLRPEDPDEQGTDGFPEAGKKKKQPLSPPLSNHTNGFVL